MRSMYISQDNGITFNEWKEMTGLAVNPDANRNGNLFDDDRCDRGSKCSLFECSRLNLGRSMHGKKRVRSFSVGGTETAVAYYVCNHPTLKDARRNRNRIACVAMDRVVVQGTNPMIL